MRTTTFAKGLGRGVLTLMLAMAMVLATVLAATPCPASTAELGTYTVYLSREGRSGEYPMVSDATGKISKEQLLSAI